MTLHVKGGLLYMFLLNPQDKSPIFVQLKKQILDFVALGILKENDQLPSVRSLANELGINPNTVAKAYQELEAEGVLYTIAGKGCFVRQSNIDQQIVQGKIEELEYCLKECRKYGVEKDMILQILDKIYSDKSSEENGKGEDHA